MPTAKVDMKHRVINAQYKLATVPNYLLRSDVSFKFRKVGQKQRNHTCRENRSQRDALARAPCLP